MNFFNKRKLLNLFDYKALKTYLCFIFQSNLGKLVRKLYLN